MSGRPPWAMGGRFATVIDPDGNPPCSEPDGCTTCALFSRQRPIESRQEWLDRLVRAAYPQPTIPGGTRGN